MQIPAPFYSQKWNTSDWHRLGFKNEEEALYWEKSSCGILCLKMAAEALQPEKEKLLVSAYIKKGLELRAYSDKNGWSHSGLVTLAHALGMQSEKKEIINSDELKRLLTAGKLVVASIKWAFEPNKTLREKILFWKKTGGHLALVVGYGEEEDEPGFYVHHTSTRPDYNWEAGFIPLDKFEGGFTGRGIVLGC